MSVTPRVPMPARPRKLKPALKFTLEFGPLALFFLSYATLGIFAATGVMMVSALVTLAVSYKLLGRVPIMPLVTAAIVLVFGSLTLFYHDETLIKIKPTVLYLLFAAAMFFGIAFRKPMLQIMFDGAFRLTPEGWRRLTWRWAFFFLFLAALNELIWRTQTTAHWVTFKSFGFIPLTVLFALAQGPLISKFEAAGEEASEEI
jgi:intracellular septation protein